MENGLTGQGVEVCQFPVGLVPAYTIFQNGKLVGVLYDSKYMLLANGQRPDLRFYFYIGGVMSEHYHTPEEAFDALMAGRSD